MVAYARRKLLGAELSNHLHLVRRTIYAVRTERHLYRVKETTK